MASNLVYVSERKPNCTEDEIQKILASCKRNNTDLDITGVLLYSDKYFVQYLEGEFSKIFGLYDKIKKDTRHRNVIMISASVIEERSFPSWQMGCKKFDYDSITYETAMSSEEKEQFKAILSGTSFTGNRALDLMKKFFR